jgi:hypothetical protein
MLKQDVISEATRILTELLSPACQAAGVSLRNMPDGGDIGIVRVATVVPFVAGTSISSSTNSANWHERQTGQIKAKCYAIVLAASQIGPRGAVDTLNLVVSTLDGVRTGPGTAWPDLETSQVLTGEASFTSHKDGIWQYRTEIDMSFAYSGENLTVKQDLAQQITTW